MFSWARGLSRWTPARASKNAGAAQVRLNAYKPGQGIHPHLDGPVYFPRAAIVSLGSHCIFDFYPRMGEPEARESAVLVHRYVRTLVTHSDALVY